MFNCANAVCLELVEVGQHAVNRSGYGHALHVHINCPAELVLRIGCTYIRRWQPISAIGIFAAIVPIVDYHVTSGQVSK